MYTRVFVTTMHVSVCVCVYVCAYACVCAWEILYVYVCFFKGEFTCLYVQAYM